MASQFPQGSALARVMSIAEVIQDVRPIKIRCNKLNYFAQLAPPKGGRAGYVGGTMRGGCWNTVEHDDATRAAWRVA